MNYELVIKIENSQIVGHPMLLSSLSGIIPNFDPYNLPENYVYFERVVEPDLKWYEKSASHQYALVNGIAKDVWTIEAMTPIEKQQARSNLIYQWMDMTGWASWSFNEETGAHDPPVPLPGDGKNYQWNEENRQWVLIEEQ